MDKEARWTEWDEWECCSASCGEGTMSRFRKCIDDYGTESDSCNGTDTESMTCIQWNESCDGQFNLHRDPEWDQWTAWNDCSVSCGNGTASRVRLCYDWEGAVSKDCDGFGIEVLDCSAHKCITGTVMVQETTEGKYNLFLCL